MTPEELEDIAATNGVPTNHVERVVAELVAEVRRLTAEVDELHDERVYLMAARAQHYASLEAYRAQFERMAAERAALRSAATAFIAQLGDWLDREGYDWADLRTVDLEVLENAIAATPSDTVAVPRLAVTQAIAELEHGRDHNCRNEYERLGHMHDSVERVLTELRALLRGGR